MEKIIYINDNVVFRPILFFKALTFWYFRVNSLPTTLQWQTLAKIDLHCDSRGLACAKYARALHGKYTRGCHVTVTV